LARKDYQNANPENSAENSAKTAQKTVPIHGGVGAVFRKYLRILKSPA
jgi:hypothetical protein